MSIKATTNGVHEEDGRTVPLQAGLAYLRGGISVIPVRLDGSKAPAVSAWASYQEERASEDQAQRWWDKPNPPGVAVICGKVSGNLERIDFDENADEFFPVWRDLVEAERPGLIARLSISKTPRPGYQVGYRCSEVVIPGNAKLAAKPGVDPVTKKRIRITTVETRGEGGYCLAPGCPPECHSTGRLYEHFSGPTLSHVSTITAREREVLIRIASSFDIQDSAESKSSGQRPGDDFNQSGWSWDKILTGWKLVKEHNDGKKHWARPGKEKGWSATTGFCTAKVGGHELFVVFSQNADPFPGPSNGKGCSTHSKFDAYALIHHAGDYKAAARELGRLGFGDQERKRKKGTDGPPNSDNAKQQDDDNNSHLTDVGNGERFVKDHGLDVRFCHPWATWQNYIGTRWAADETGLTVLKAKQTIAGLFDWTTGKMQELGRMLASIDPESDEAAELKRKLGQLKRVLDWCLKSEDARRIKAMLEMARSEPGIPILPSEFDPDHFLLNCTNGTLDLRSGKLLPHRREDYISKICPVVFEADASCPLWDKFLLRIMAGNQDLIDYLQRVIGYALTGDVREQSLWFLHGSGSNGKTTFLMAIREMLGDYAIQAVSELLMQKGHETHPTERADLFGRRFVATIETDEGKKMAEALMKQVTGGDPLKARKMRQDFFEFLPTWKIFLAANHKPIIRGTDHAVWRRIKLVPFTVKIEDGEKDKDLINKLKKELPGILAWAVRGCLAWQKDGLGEPDEVRQATAAYEAESNTVRQFIDACCIVHPSAKIQSSVLLKAYSEWSGDKFTSQMAFTSRMEKLGFPSEAGHGNRRFYKGLGLPAPDEQERHG